MKQIIVVVWVLALSLAAPALQAQETNEVELLRKQLQEAKDNFEKTVQQQREMIEALTQRLDEWQRKQQTPITNHPGATNALSLSVAPTPPPAASPSLPTTEPKQPWSPSQPITLARSGSAYMNIAFDALVDLGWSTDPNVSQNLNLGDHDPQQRGFSLPNAEIALDGAVDPYFKGFANIALRLDDQNDTHVELEEAYLQSISLPANLQVKAGQFLANFGRENTQHPHQWAFVDQSIILNRTFGPEGLRNVGAQLSWLAPTPFFLEASLGFLDGQGESAFSFRNQGVDGLVHGRATLDRGLSGLADFLYLPRLATSFDLTPQQTLVVGISGALGPNDTAPDTRTEIYGADIYWKWKSANAQLGFPFVSWQTEVLYQRFGAGSDFTAMPPLPAENLRDWGFYSEVLWGIKPRWVAGLRGEYADGNLGAYDPWDVYRGERVRVSPDMTWYFSEFSKLRLQYNYDWGRLFGTEHSVWLQVEFLLGAHGAHKF